MGAKMEVLPNSLSKKEGVINSDLGRRNPW